MIFLLLKVQSIVSQSKLNFLLNFSPCFSMTQSQIHKHYIIIFNSRQIQDASRLHSESIAFHFIPLQLHFQFFIVLTSHLCLSLAS